MRFFLDAIGCRLNHSEMERLARKFTGQGHVIVRDPALADICILNTCAVTADAERKSRQAANRIARQNPGAQIVLTGCYVTLSPNDTCLDNFSHIVCNKDKPFIPTILGIDDPLSSPCWYLPKGRTRAFVQVQDGCDNRCTYCVTTIARGPSVSRPVTEIVEEIQALADAGYNEVVLTGVNLGDFKSINTKSDLDYRKTNPSLRTLIEAILSETDISRLRLSSIEPWDLDPEFFSLWENPRLCRQLHLPLQSGTDSVLKRMGRRITAESYQSLALEAQSAIPNLALTTDVIVGFPGETDQEHNASLSFVQSLKFARLHVFSFSARPGTKAYYIAGKIDAQVIKSRNLEMRQLGKDLQRQFLAGHIGKTMNVLWEKTDHCGNWQGHTGNYIQVTTHSANYLRNTITPTILVELLDDKMRGIIL